MTDELTDREALQALLNGDEEALEKGTQEYRVNEDSLEFRSAAGDGPWMRVFCGTFRRPGPEPATFADAIPHLLEGRRCKLGAGGRVMALEHDGLAYEDGETVPITAQTLISNDWLVQINGRWVSAGVECGE